MKITGRKIHTEQRMLQHFHCVQHSLLLMVLADGLMVLGDITANSALWVDSKWNLISGNQLQAAL